MPKSKSTMPALLVSAALFFSPAIFVLAPSSALAQDSAVTVDAKYLEVVGELTKITGKLDISSQIANSVIQSMVANMQSRGTPIPPRAMDIVRETASEHFGDVFGTEKEMIATLAKSYAKHFTREDLEGLVKFYNTPLGAKMRKAMPDVMKDSMAVGQEKSATRMPAFQAALRDKFEAEAVFQRQR